jgi:threonylcarbamoyladenosine tRNA methylthiotransferase MtaB
MGRHWYKAASYALAVERIAKSIPVFGLGADIIAGFPGETEDDHRCTVALVEALPFTYLHVFPYSLRPGTAAERLDGHVAASTIECRAAELRGIADRRAAAHRASRVGGECDLVVMGSAARREGLTEDYLTVAVDPSIPRGTRCRARLHGDASRLLGVPLQAIIR